MEGRKDFFFFERVCVLQRDGGDLSDFLQEENGHDNGDNVRVHVCVCVPGVHEEEEVERHGRLKNENLLPAFSNPAVHFFWNVLFCCFFFFFNIPPCKR